MNNLKKCGVVAVSVGTITESDVILIISIVITVLGMVQEALKKRKEG